MASVALNSFAGDALAASDIAGGVYAVPGGYSALVQISLVNTDRGNSHRFNCTIKRAADGKTVYRSAADDVLLPGQGWDEPASNHGTIKLSAGDEIHLWGDAQIHYLITGGLAA